MNDLQAQMDKLLLFGAPSREALDNAPCCSTCGARLSVEEIEDNDEECRDCREHW